MHPHDHIRCVDVVPVFTLYSWRFLFYFLSFVFGATVLVQVYTAPL